MWLNHLQYKWIIMKMDLRQWWWKWCPDSVTLALFGMFGICVAAAFFVVCVFLAGIWTLFC